MTVASAAKAIPGTRLRADAIRSHPLPNCYLCNTPGALLYEGLKDRLFGAPGMWNFRQCSNSDCAMVWLDPMPLAEDLDIAYLSYPTHELDAASGGNFARRLYSRMQAAYVRTKYQYRPDRRSRWDLWLTALAWLNPIRRENCDFSVFYLASKPGGRLLDLGCGSGAMLESMQELGWQVEGVDFDPAAVNRARERGLTVHLGTLTEQRFPEGTFDAIIASHLIEHVPEPVATLEECRRILKPGGRLVLTTPNARSWGHRFYKSDWRGLEPPRHLGIFTPSAMEAMCLRAGLRPVECRAIVRASGILMASRQLHRAGRLQSSYSPSWRVRLWEEIRGLVQWAGSLVDSAAGEEVLLICSK